MNIENEFKPLEESEIIDKVFNGTLDKAKKMNKKFDISDNFRHSRYVMNVEADRFDVINENGEWKSVVPSIQTPLPVEKDGTLHSVVMHIGGLCVDKNMVIDEKDNGYSINDFLERFRVFIGKKLTKREYETCCCFNKFEELPCRVISEKYNGKYGFDVKDYFGQDGIVIEIDFTKNGVGISEMYSKTLQLEDFIFVMFPEHKIEKDKNIEYLTPSETASALGVTVDCLRKWDEAGRLKPDIVTEGGHRRYLKERIDEIANVNTVVSKTLCYRGLDYKIDEIKHVKTHSLTNGEMIWLDEHFSEYPDKKYYIKMGDVWKYKKENTSCYNNVSNQIIKDGLEIVEEYFKECGGIEKYGKQHYDDFKIMWRLLVADKHCFWKDLEKGRIELIVDKFRNVLNSYNFIPLFRAYKTNSSMNDYGVYRLMMDEFRLEVMSNIEMMINEYDKKCYMEVYEELKNDTITQFENLDYNVLRVIYGLWNVDFYIEDFVLPENRKCLEIQVKDKEIFEKMCEKFHNNRRKTYNNHYSTCNVPCIDDYLHDWFF